MINLNPAIKPQHNTHFAQCCAHCSLNGCSCFLTSTKQTWCPFYYCCLCRCLLSKYAVSAILACLTCSFHLAPIEVTVLYLLETMPRRRQSAFQPAFHTCWGTTARFTWVLNVRSLILMIYSALKLGVSYICSRIRHVMFWDNVDSYDTVCDDP